MKNCPLMSYAKQYSYQVPCMKEQCGFSDEAGNCLIQQALQCYIAKESTVAAQKEIYYKMHKDGTLDPVIFNQHTTKVVDIDSF
jgi:hypothetical protein